MDGTMLMTTKGQNEESIELYLNKIKIKGPNHEFVVALSKISAVLFVGATGIVPGSIEFFFSGAALLQHKFNHIIFSHEQQPAFEKIRDGIEKLMLDIR